jgi:hypothetical protein
MSYTHPDSMTTEERLNEAAKIISTGIMRFLENKRKIEKFPLDKSPTKCLHGEKPFTGENHEQNQHD